MKRLLRADSWNICKKISSLSMRVTNWLLLISPYRSYRAYQVCWPVSRNQRDFSVRRIVTNLAKLSKIRIVPSLSIFLRIHDDELLILLFKATVLNNVLILIMLFSNYSTIENIQINSQCFNNANDPLSLILFIKKEPWERPRGQRGSISMLHLFLLGWALKLILSAVRPDVLVLYIMSRQTDLVISLPLAFLLLLLARAWVVTGRPDAQFHDQGNQVFCCCCYTEKQHVAILCESLFVIMMSLIDGQ